jgi:protein-disulfide isomerase
MRRSVTARHRASHVCGRLRSHECRNLGILCPVTRNRLYLLAAAAAAAIAVVAVVVVVSASGGSSSPTTTAVVQPSGSGSSIFAGVPQRGDTLGRADAPATLTVFEDPQCPYCRQWNLDTLPTVVRDYVKTGRVKIVYRGIEIIGVNSVAGLRAAYAAGMQNKLWNLVEALYERQGAENSDWITLAVIREAATSVHANAAKLIKDADSKAVTAALNAAEKERQSYGINATPAFAIQRQLGTLQPLQVTSLEPDGFTTALTAALQ